MIRYLIFYSFALLLFWYFAEQTLVSSIESRMLTQQKRILRNHARLMARRIERQLIQNPDGEHRQLAKSVLQPALELGEWVDYISSDGQLLLQSESAQLDSRPENQREKPEIISAIETKKTGFGKRNNRTFAAAAVVIDSTDVKGVVRVSESFAPIVVATGRASRIARIFAACMALLGGIVFMLYSRNSLKPLDVFAEIARQIGSGNDDQIPPLHGRQRDKWSVLSDAFRYMQQELETREHTVLENSSRLRAVLSSMVEGVLAIDSAGDVMLANGAACEILQMAHEEIVGRQFIEIFRIPELTEAIARTQAEQVFSSCEFQTRGLPRKIIDARVSVLANTEQDDRTGVAIVLFDITELRQLENLRRDFVANVSHELKTPLSSIKAYAETLKMGAINDSSKNMQFLENIEAQAEVLNDQIQDLLQLARVESGEENWEIVPVSVNSVCASCVKQFQSEAVVRKVSLKLAPAQQECFVKADRDGLKTILNNLIGNAVHYTLEGGNVEIFISLAGKHVKIEVVDDGIGISPDHHARIFERFYRVDKARSRDQGGTGLGLSIVKHLCLAFGGSVELESSVGKGSRFIVKIPNVNGV